MPLLIDHSQNSAIVDFQEKHPSHKILYNSIQYIPRYIDIVEISKTQHRSVTFRAIDIKMFQVLIYVKV